jgi:hypothetical protein
MMQFSGMFNTNFMYTNASYTKVYVAIWITVGGLTIQASSYSGNKSH